MPPGPVAAKGQNAGAVLHVLWCAIYLVSWLETSLPTNDHESENCCEDAACYGSVDCLEEDDFAAMSSLQTKDVIALLQGLSTESSIAFLGQCF